MRKTPFMSKFLPKIASRIGAKVVIEPKWKHVGQITFKNGRKRYFRCGSIDLNTIGAMEIAQDKDYANFFMEKMGYPVVESRTFYSDKWAAAIESKDDLKAALTYAKSLGFPVIAKPNSKSQGLGVALARDEKGLLRALEEIFEYDKVAIVQRPVKGKDHRIVVLDNKVLSAYERIPLSVTGDGKMDIRGLLRAKQSDFKRSSRDTVIRESDPRMTEKLASLGLSFASVPKKKEKIFLLDNANLSTGGDSIDVTDTLDRKWKNMAVKLTKDMGLRLCGVDIMIDGKDYKVLEVNSAPGLDHYAKSGKEQQKIVEDLYIEVLKAMESDSGRLTVTFPRNISPHPRSLSSLESLFSSFL